MEGLVTGQEQIGVDGLQIDFIGANFEAVDNVVGIGIKKAADRRAVAQLQIEESIGSVAAAQDIRAHAADDNISAAATVERVVSDAASQVVVATVAG